ncbi:hypothetical protein KFE98_17800 [bacterium SCSIO 12741]|nr:hypothetical protein KFE98_17800 [bacterium SCSIO 12741]
MNRLNQITILFSLCIVLLGFVPSQTWAQSNSPEDSEVYQTVDQMPEFAHGADSLSRYLINSLTVNAECDTNDYLNKIYVSFIVDTLGQVVNVDVIRGASPCMDSLMTQTFEDMPPWNPGKHEGKKVAVKLVTPIHIRIR